MNTGSHNAPGDIIINADDYVYYEYCTNTNSEGQCIEWLQVVPASSLQLQNQNNASWLSNTVMYCGVIFLLIRLIKGIFRLILPSKGKK